MDGEIDIFEYTLTTVMRQYLVESMAPRIKNGSLKLIDTRAELRDLFSTIARFGHDSQSEAQYAYEQGMRQLLPYNPPEYLPPVDWNAAMDHSLSRLDRLAPLGKEALLAALVATVTFDKQVTVNEVEFIRAVCSMLHCTPPPINGSACFAKPLKPITSSAHEVRWEG